MKWIRGGFTPKRYPSSKKNQKRVLGGKAAQETVFNMRTVSVIVSKCEGSLGYHRVYERISEDVFDSLEKAREVGESKRGEKLSVIVRPNYNEVGFFQEWRSFDGAPFKNAQFKLGA